MARRARWVASVLALSVTVCAASEMANLVHDDEDGAFDLSELLLTPKGFLPIPLLITEPAVGYGLGLAPVWFHRPPEIVGGDRPQLIVPSASVVAGFATLEGSWGVGGGHLHSWGADTWRYRGFAGYGALELSTAGLDERYDRTTVDYGLDVRFVVQEVSRRVAEGFRVGLRYRYSRSDVRVEDFERLSTSTRIAGLGLVLSFDGRDNLLSPNRGWRIDLRPSYQAEWLGGDAEYAKVTVRSTGQWNPTPLRLGVKFDGGWAGDGAPFYDLPFIQLRGVPALAYLGEYAMSIEGEIGWDVTQRWTVLAFGGLGRADDAFAWTREASEIESGGAGVRYLLARRFGLRAGTDLAWGPGGDFAFYVVVGSPWF